MGEGRQPIDGIGEVSGGKAELSTRVGSSLETIELRARESSW